jgi:monothiol glutaredoxin
MHDVTFGSHNVLADEELRQGIKEFSNWPTIPQVGSSIHPQDSLDLQVYLDGEFVGGCDIMLQMHQVQCSTLCAV